MICSKSPQPLSHIHICPKPKVKLGPTDLIYPAPPSSFDIATTRTLVISVSPIGISVSPRWDCKLSISLRNVSVQLRWAIGPTDFAMQTLCFPFVTFRSYRNERFGPTEFAWPTLCVPITEIGPTEFMCSVSPRLRYALTLTKSVLPSWHVGPTEKPNGHIMNWISLTEFSDSVPPSLVNLCGGYIYPSTRSSFVKRAIRTYLHFQYTFSKKEPPTHVLRPRYSKSYHMNLDL